MDISAFLNPVKEEVVENCHLTHKKQLGNTITIFKNEDDFPELEGCLIAIVGLKKNAMPLTMKDVRLAQMLSVTPYILCLTTGLT